MGRYLLISLFIVFQSAFAIEMIPIGNSKCSSYIGKFGLEARNLCVKGKDAYVCTDKNGPFGAKLPKYFYSDLKIKRSQLARSLKKICKAESSKVVSKSETRDCGSTQHALFNTFLPFGGSTGICFCDERRETVLATCVQAGKGWKSTGEFLSSFVRKKLDVFCSERSHPNYAIACFCGFDSGNDQAKYMACLKRQTAVFSTQPVSPAPLQDSSSAR
jgi:hypothetical protein